MYLGIDLGTSEVKVLLLDAGGQIVATAGAPLEVSRPQARWSEQAPDSWWDAAQQAIATLQAAHGAALAAVRGIGLSGQMHGATLLDHSDRPLRPAILWNDTRADEECQALYRLCPDLEQITGNLAMPGFTAPKLLWVARHEPEIFARTASVLLPKDYLRLCLTGDKVGEMSDASGTLWLDVGARDWSERMLAACQLVRAQMPRLVEGSAAGGQLLASLAQRWGMRQPVLVAGGGGDNAASAVGVGAISPGDGFVSLGTSGVLFLVTDRFRPNPASAVHAFCHALPQRWHQMSVMLSAASCLRWATHLTASTDEAALLDQVARLDPQARAGAPLFLPYLSGERTPHNDARAQGVLFGITHDTDAARLGYAVLEGVTFGLADGLAALLAAGSRAEVLSLVGGGARSAYWAQLIADVFGIPVRTHSGGEAGAALGAARLGWLACGGSQAEVCVKPPVAREFAPDAAGGSQLAPRRERFRALYPAVKPLYA